MIILLAVLALVVVKALAESPWGVFTVGATIPIAMFMGGYLRFWRVGKVLEASAIGVVLLLLAVWGGKFVHRTRRIGAASSAFKRDDLGLDDHHLRPGRERAAGLAAARAARLSQHVHEARHDFRARARHFPGAAQLANARDHANSSMARARWSPGKLFPFCFITIACGAISGFHTLIASGTTPKIITRESYARPIGYGAMCLESLVAIMALIAACTLDPGVYLSMKSKGERRRHGRQGDMHSVSR